MLRAILLSLIVSSSSSARILGIVSAPHYSHQVVYQPLWRELSLRGHQLTVLTTFPLNDPSLTNLTEINLNSTIEAWNEINVLVLSKKHFLKIAETVLTAFNKMIGQQLEHPEVQALIKNQSEHYDLLIVEVTYPALYAFSKRFNCPFIGAFSMDVPPLVYTTTGNPAHPVLNPSIMLPFVGKLTFWERLISTLFSLFMEYYSKVYVLPSQERLVKKYFGNDYPPLEDIARGASMMFVNTDPILHQIRPLLPSVVQIGGGIHLKPPQKLPKGLQTQLDKASDGFIYFSLGSNVKSTDLSEDTRRVLLETFAELPYTVLWKFESENLPEKPDNVIMSTWFPQQDIFRHPHIKLFITQGGLQSIEEAVYNHIPIVGMSIFGDQLRNIKMIVSKGLGLAVDYTSLNKESLKNTIAEVIKNPKYRNKVRELAELAKDQPTTGLERAVWWTEYVLRHKGAKHLRSPAMDLPFYQYFLLDVAGFCLLVFLLSICLIVILIKLSYKIINYGRSQIKTKVH